MVEEVCERECDWPKDRSRILAELDRLKSNEEKWDALLKQLIELTVEMRNLGEKISTLTEGGTSWAHREVEKIHRTLGEHAVELRDQKVRIGLLSGFFGVVGGVASSLIGWLIHSK